MDTPDKNRDAAARSTKDRARIKLERDMGPLIVTALYDPLTTDICLNPDGTLWHLKHGKPWKMIGHVEPARAQAILETIAGFLNKTVTAETPILEGELPLDGSRFAGQLPSVVTAPTFSIRKKAVQIFTLDQYVESGIMTAGQRQALHNAVINHRNILVVGGTGSGKTTLVNAIINEMVTATPGERVVIIEDTGEIQCAAENYVQYHTHLDVSITDLIKATLRMRPDRIIVGEVRDGAALDLIDAWTIGRAHVCTTVTSRTRMPSFA